MNIIFQSTEQYERFLKKLVEYCDELRIIDDYYENKFFKSVQAYVFKANWTRRFPGYGRSHNMKVLSISFDHTVGALLREYHSFLDIGSDEEDFDMAFYRNGKLVFLVISHEDLCFLEEEHEAFFAEVLNGSFDRI